MRRHLPSVLAATAVLAAGCGGAAGEGADGVPGTVDRSRMMPTTSVPGSAGADSPGEAAGLPPVPLVDVASGATVELSSLVPSSTPILAWFWTPF